MRLSIVPPVLSSTVRYSTKWQLSGGEETLTLVAAVCLLNPLTALLEDVAERHLRAARTNADRF